MPFSLHHDEHEASAKREICVGPCRKSIIPHEYTDEGPICRKDADSATEVKLQWVINGRTFTKTLKGRIVVVETSKKRRK